MAAMKVVFSKKNLSRQGEEKEEFSRSHVMIYIFYFVTLDQNIVSRYLNSRLIAIRQIGDPGLVNTFLYKSKVKQPTALYFST